jgi:hypothetical protein
MPGLEEYHRLARGKRRLYRIFQSKDERLGNLPQQGERGERP